MEIIGEKLNATRAEVAEAIASRDVDRVQDLARRQVEAGAAYLDVNAAGVQKSKEPEDLVWLVESVQAAVDVPLCLDSANPEALTAALAVVQRTPLVNSISGEAERLDPILPSGRRARLLGHRPGRRRDRHRQDRRATHGRGAEDSCRRRARRACPTPTCWSIRWCCLWPVLPPVAR